MAVSSWASFQALLDCSRQVGEAGRGTVAPSGASTLSIGPNRRSADSMDMADMGVVFLFTFC